MLIVVFGVVTLVFFILRIASGDPAHLMNPPGQQEELVQLTRERLGTDRASTGRPGQLVSRWAARD
jgi:ABC-type dipeptide/oligopeptide/nickel transport system permease component